MWIAGGARFSRLDARQGRRSSDGEPGVHCGAWRSVCYAGLILFLRVSNERNVRTSGKDYGSAEWAFSS
jgi:hypothetical protein